MCATQNGFKYKFVFDITDIFDWVIRESFLKFSIQEVVLSESWSVPGSKRQSIQTMIKANYRSQICS